MFEVITFEILDCRLISNILIWTSGGLISKLEFNDQTKSFHNAHLYIARVEIGHGVETVQRSKERGYFSHLIRDMLPVQPKPSTGTSPI